jgi:hypothetical protein
MDPSGVTVESWEAAGQTILWNLNGCAGLLSTSKMLGPSIDATKQLGGIDCIVCLYHQESKAPQSQESKAPQSDELHGFPTGGGVRASRLAHHSGVKTLP